MSLPVRPASLLCILLLLAACGKQSEEAPPPKLFQDQRDALDNAKAVEADLQKNEEAQRKAIEQQTQ